MSSRAPRPVTLACLAASPVYYQAPLYRRLAEDRRLEFTAIFASSAGATRPMDNGYGQPVVWGVDPLRGYSSIFLRRAARNPIGGGVLALRDLDIVHVLNRGRFDVLWLHGYHTITHVAAACTQLMLGGQRLFREEQTLLTPRPLWKTMLKGVGLRSLFSGSYGLFIGTENRRWFRRWGVAEERLFHAPYVVDNDRLRAAAAALAPRRTQLKEALGIAPDAGPVILFVGRLIAKKQPLHLLEAFRQVRSEDPCTLLVVGSGPLEREMRESVALESIPDVVFAGFLDQTKIANAYAVSDIFSLPSSHDETWGLVVNEAMNFDLPIVVTDRVGCATDLVVDGSNGFVVPFADRDALSGALRALVQSPALRSRFGKASGELIREWHYDRTAAGVLKAVEAAVGAERWSHAG